MKLWTLEAQVFTSGEFGMAAVMAETRHEAMEKARAKLLQVLNFLKDTTPGGVPQQHHRVAQAMLNNLNAISEEPDGVMICIGE